nr:sulfotransferase [Rubrobacter radiotolerans]
MGPKRPQETRFERYLFKPARKRILRSEVKLLHGPEQVTYRPDELVVVCLVRDGEPYIEQFVEHYLNDLEARHIVFLDNGSSDGTVELASRYAKDGVTVLLSKLPYREYKYLFKQYLHERFGRERWTLYVDADELFDYPYSEAVGLGAFLGYLNRKGYTAVAAQMLDMFPERPLISASVAGTVSLKEEHRFYDISQLWRSSIKNNTHLSGNHVEDHAVIETISGGIRSLLFDVAPKLTKFPLIFSDGRVTPSNNSSHRVDGARIADLSCVLYHYKFLQSFRDHARRAVKEGNYFADSFQYKKYLEVLEKSPELHIKRETSRELDGSDELIERGFLFVSEDYATLADTEERRLLNEGPQTETPEEIREALLRARQRERRQGQEIGELSRRLEEREREIGRLTRQLRRSERRLRNRENRGGGEAGDPAREVRELKRQLHEIRTSRSWRLITKLQGIKTRTLGPKGKGGPESEGPSKPLAQVVAEQREKSEPRSSERFSEELRPLFVGGCQRSGTTAFIDYLNEHEEILVCHERYKRLRRDRIAPDLFTFERILDYRPRETNKPQNIDLYVKRHADIIARKDPARLRWIGDKNPGFINTMDLLLKNNPGARFIMLYRPVEEVAESWADRAKNPDDPWLGGKDGFSLGVEAWNEAMRSLRTFVEGSDLPRVLVVSYHDFFVRNERCIPLISRFLGVEIDDEVRSSWADASLKFQSDRRAKDPLTPEQELFIREHADREAEAWVLDRIERQWSEPSLYVREGTESLLRALDENEALAWRTARRARELEEELSRERRRRAKPKDNAKKRASLSGKIARIRRIVNSRLSGKG